MSFKVETVPQFEKEAKKLSKKYPSLKRDLLQLTRLLESNPEHGTPLGSNVYKIRLSISSKGKGKSGGARVITYIKRVKDTIYLVSIYDKKQRDTLNKKELEKLLKKSGLL